MTISASLPAERHVAPTSAAHELCVLSHRGPMQAREEGGWRRSAGGLVTALDPILRSRRGVWISAGAVPPPGERAELGYELASAAIPGDMEIGFYEAVSNAVLWPLLHSFPPTIRVGEAPWRDYQTANRIFATTCLASAGPRDLLWVHDYHLMLVPQLLRHGRPRARIGWFCHIPWPGLDLFAILPWRREIVEGLLGADVIGFHTTHFAENFLACVERFTSAQVAGRTVRHQGRAIRVVTAPIGVPVAEVRALASAETTTLEAADIHASVMGRRVVLGVDRLDYTKGIPERILAYRQLLESRPEAAAETVMVQVMVPSRTDVEAYARLKEEVDRLVGEVNGRFGETGRVAIHYLYRNLEWPTLVAHYRAADVALVTPLRDGMNLVAQEYVAARVDGDGVLVLSEFAGAAEYLAGALRVNPYDVGGIASALEHALAMPEEERRQRMRTSRAAVENLEVHAWADRFIRMIERAGSLGQRGERQAPR